MIELLEACVRIRSLSGQEQKVAEFLCDRMSSLGFRAHVDPAGNAVGVIGDGPRQVVLLGHMDTVDGDVPVRYENGALYGRGTVDAKGPLCAFILASAQLLHANQASLKDWQIIVIGATEEEAVTSKGARYAAGQYRPEYCLIGEPSGADGITLGYKGRLVVNAHYEQASRHTATPGPSTAEQSVTLWNWVDAYARKFNTDRPKAFDQIMPSLRSICSREDGMREWCDMLLSLRLPMDMGPHEMQREIEKSCQGEEEKRREGEEMSESHETQVQLTSASFPVSSPPLLLSTSSPLLYFSGHEQAYRSSRDSRLAYAFVDAIRAEGARPAFKLKTGTADFNVVGPIWQCPIVAHGPGDSALDHTPDEHVDIEEFERSVRVLLRVLQSVISQ